MAPNTLSPAVIMPDDDARPKQEQVLSKSGLQTFYFRIILSDTADIFCPGT
jgi:hypothetical protein